MHYQFLVLISFGNVQCENTVVDLFGFFVVRFEFLYVLSLFDGLFILFAL
eukprot:UN07043